ncbi:MAG: TolC family protein [Candidatus Omnitrophica bacterium]|nr:TolC family protein [Candidatus Omnitrophota bacterium]
MKRAAWIVALLLALPSPAFPEERKLSLEECFRMALAKSEDVAIRKEALTATRADYLKAANEALGDIRFLVTDTRQDAAKPAGAESGGVGGTLSSRHRRERKFVFEQPLFQGFKSLGAIVGAGSLRGQRKEEWKRTRQLLFLDVAATYYEVLTLRNEVAIMKTIRSLFKERVKDLETREKIGRSRVSEVLTTRSRMKSLEADLETTRGNLAKAMHALEYYTGALISPAELEDPEPTVRPGESLQDSVSRAVKRPDVEAAWKAAETAKQGIVVAQSGLWPLLTLEHNEYVKRDGFQSGTDWDLILKLDVPLFRGGENMAKIQEAVSRYKTARLNHSMTLRDAQLEIKSAYEDWLASRRRSKKLKAAVSMSEENFTVQREEYLRNLVNNLEVLDALESLLEIRRAANRAQYEVEENARRLEVASGYLPYEAQP